MNSRKILAFVMFVGSLTLILIGGLYNPYSQPVDLQPGNYVAYEFNMNQNETRHFDFESMDFFTVYIANQTAYEESMKNGNFSSCYYTASGKDIHVDFTAPKDGSYYVIIANFNSRGFIEVVFSYGQREIYSLIATGAVLGILAIGVTLWSMREDNKPPVLDSICPYCGNRVNSSWNFCPYCDYPLRREEK